MRATHYEPIMPLSTRVGSGDPTAQPSMQPPAAGEPAWQSQVFVTKPAAQQRRQRATRYERFTTRMVLVSSLLMLGVTAALHVFNYDLETQTSSTSGTHSDFHKEGAQ